MPPKRTGRAKKASEPKQPTRKSSRDKKRKISDEEDTARSQQAKKGKYEGENDTELIPDVKNPPPGGKPGSRPENQVQYTDQSTQTDPMNKEELEELLEQLKKHDTSQQNAPTPSSKEPDAPSKGKGEAAPPASSSTQASRSGKRAKAATPSNTKSAWCEILQSREQETSDLASLRIPSQMTSESPNLFIQLQDISWLEYPDVFAAIGCVWAALYKAGALFSFGEDGPFQLMIDGSDTGSGYAVHSDVFIVPVILTRFNVDEEDQGGKIIPRVKPKQTKKLANEDYRTNHILLMVARRTGKSDQVSLSYYDSSGKCRDDNVIRHAARNVVRQSGWAGMGQDNVQWAEDSFQPVPQQTIAKGQGTCGIHTIMNAWAIMLDIDPVPRRKPNVSVRTCQEARTIINEALAGKLSIATIRAFLICKGFAEPTDVSEDTRYLPNEVQTFAMSTELLSEFIEQEGIGF